MKEIKELEEATKKTVKILDEIVGLVQTRTMHFHFFGKGLEGTKTTTEYARQILNLRGDGWKIAIIGDIKSTYHSDTTDKALKFPSRQVIWEAE